MTTTTEARVTEILATLLPEHAAVATDTYPYGAGLTFASALREARCYGQPWVLQQRATDDAGHTSVLSSVCVTHYTGATDDAEMILWIPATGPERTGAWQPNVLTVTAAEMQGRNWCAISDEAARAANALAMAAERAASDSVMIPRTAEAAQHRARILRLYGENVAASDLDSLARWLPGGEMMQRGHQLAADIDLCGEYEAAVVPTLGWTPRRGTGNSRMALTTYWHAEMDRIESASTGAAAAIAEALARVVRGGVVNMAITEHAENHLERHKRPAVNELLAELGMDPIGGGTREYEVELRVERTRTVTEYATVTVTVEASDEDEASDIATDSDTYYDELTYAHWVTEDDCYDTEVTEVYTESVTEA